MSFNVGDRVRLIADFNDWLNVPAGSLGTIVSYDEVLAFQEAAFPGILLSISDEPDATWIRLDDHYSELDEYNNAYQLWNYYDDPIENYLEHV